MNTFELTLTEDELNYIFKVIGSQPYIEVFKLINTIQNQIAKQQNDNEQKPDQNVKAPENV